MHFRHSGDTLEYFVVLRVKPRTLHMLGKHFGVQLHSRPLYALRQSPPLLLSILQLLCLEC